MHSRFLLALAALAALTLACHPSGDDTGGRSPAHGPVSANALAGIDTADSMRHVRVLSHASLPGRAHGSVGEHKPVAYLESQFKSRGLQPGNTDGTYLQNGPLVGITVKGA